MVPDRPTDTAPSLAQLLATYQGWSSREVLVQAHQRAEASGDTDRAAALRSMLETDVAAVSAVDALAAQHELSSLLNGWRWQTVFAARTGGASWAEIARATNTDADTARAEFLEHVDRSERTALDLGLAFDDAERYRAAAGAPPEQAQTTTSLVPEAAVFGGPDLEHAMNHDDPTRQPDPSSTADQRAGEQHLGAEDADNLSVGSGFVMFDPAAPGGVRELTPQENGELARAIRVPSQRVDEDGREELYRAEQGLDAPGLIRGTLEPADDRADGDGPAGDGVEGAGLADLPLSELLDRAERCQQSVHVGDSDREAAARLELLALDEEAARRAGDQPPDSVDAQASELIALRGEDLTPAIEREAQSRSRYLGRTLAAEQAGREAEAGARPERTPSEALDADAASSLRDRGNLEPPAEQNDAEVHQGIAEARQRTERAARATAARAEGAAGSDLDSDMRRGQLTRWHRDDAQQQEALDLGSEAGLEHGDGWSR